MKNRLNIGFLLISITLFSFINDYKAKTSDSPTRVNFYSGGYDSFLREAKKQKKAILLDFWATWCGPCKKMDIETFNNEELSNYLNENFLVYKINIDDFDGMKIADKYAVDAFPTLLMIDNKGKVIRRYRGFFPPNYLLAEFHKNKK